MAINYTDVLLAGRYEMQGHLATGGMSVVYRAWDHHLCRPVAIKILREGSHDNVAHIVRFRREAHTASLLHSPYIVEFYDFFEEHGTNYMVMELIEGVHLKNYIVARGRLASIDALLIAEQICLALTEVHAQGFLHRDIKPQNILLDPLGNARLADFGIVHIAAARSLTSDGMVLGTADYISPEQAQGLPLGPTTDLYSLGTVLFEMLAGALPFTGTTPIAVAMQHATLPPPPLRSLAPDIPRTAERLVRRALAKKPEQRFQSAYDMGMALRQVREELQLAQEKFAASERISATAAQTFNLRHRQQNTGKQGGPDNALRPSYPIGTAVDYAAGDAGYDDISDIDMSINGTARLARRRPLGVSALPALLLFVLFVLFFLSIVFLHILS